MRSTRPANFTVRRLPLLLLAGLASFALGLAPSLSSAQAQESEPSATDEAAAEGEEESSAPDDPASEDSEAPASEEAEPAPTAQTDDVETLRAEYFKLRDRLFQSRARASAVASALYSTRLAVQLDYKSARYYTVTRATIRLDGANIYDDTSAAISSDDASRFEGYIAPGRHLLSIRIEATGKDDDRFTSIIDNSFIVQATKDKDLQVHATAQDDGDIAYSWSKKQRGSYNLQMKVKVKTVKRAAQTSQIRQAGERRSDALTPKRQG